MDWTIMGLAEIPLRFISFLNKKRLLTIDRSKTKDAP